MNNMQFRTLPLNTVPFHLDDSLDYWRSTSFFMVNHSSDRASSNGLYSTRS